MALGHDPIVDTLYLVPGQDFIHEIAPPAGQTIPNGTTVDLVFYTTAGDVIATWPAAVNALQASWFVASEVADTINIPARFRVYVHYTDDADFCWYRGSVARQE